MQRVDWCRGEQRRQPLGRLHKERAISDQHIVPFLVLRLQLLSGGLKGTVLQLWLLDKSMGKRGKADKQNDNLSKILSTSQSPSLSFILEVMLFC